MTVSPRRKAGFTLIELLVVIAIIAILAAILFPVFAKVREKARQTMCASNEKQLLLGILTYASDADEDFPGTVFAKPFGGPQIYTWMVAIEPYLKNGSGSIGYTERGEIEEGGVFSCPDVTLSGFPVYSPTNDLMTNYWVNTADSSDINHRPISIENVVDPSDKILLFESGSNGTMSSTNVGFIASAWNNFNAANANPALDTFPQISDNFYKNCDTPIPNDGGWEGCYYFPRFRHNGLSNMGYSDGHVKAMRIGQFNWYVNVYNQPTFNAYAPGCGLTCAQGF
jgi:prepilin-type N-terminal cleavage/methylation domain-containing protein/prepilin-type processing-associated H-X9-DG protein